MRTRAACRTPSAPRWSDHDIAPLACSLRCVQRRHEAAWCCSAWRLRSVTLLPMFPLGTVLVPAPPLPLHVFEPRYRALVDDCLDGDREFGVVLIERGSEVGGGDVRFDIGVHRASIEHAEQTPDGRWALVCDGQVGASASTGGWPTTRTRAPMSSSR